MYRIEIFDIEPFFFAVSREIQTKIRFFWGAAECVYRDRAVEHTAYDGVPPAFIKHPRFRGQTEVRALWIPKDGELVEPMIVNAKIAVQFCRLVGASRACA